MKNTHLRSPMSKEKFVAKLASTLQAGGQVETPLPEPKIGDKMPDGTVYAGISPDTGKAMYAMPGDAPLTMKFNEAKEYAQGLNTQKTHGHDDWHAPTKNELNVLFNNRAAIGGFDVTGPYPAGWYWSASSSDEWGAWGQRFSDGRQVSNYVGDRLSVRCVRRPTLRGVGQGTMHAE